MSLLRRFLSPSLPNKVDTALLFPRNHSRLSAACGPLVNSRGRDIPPLPHRDAGTILSFDYYMGAGGLSKESPVRGSPLPGKPTHGRCDPRWGGLPTGLSPGPGPCPGPWPASRAGSRRSRGRSPLPWGGGQSARPGRGQRRSWSPPAQCPDQPASSGARQG